MSSSNGGGKRVRIIDIGEFPEPPPIRWIWKPFVPLGFLTLTEGQEGVGKGYLAAWLTVAVASGRATGRPQAVVYLTSEEEPGKVKRRLMLAGYRPGVHAPVKLLQMDDDSLVTMPQHKHFFLALQKKLGVPIGLIVVDVLRDHSAPPDDLEIRFRSNNDETWIRPAAASWQRLAGELGCAILGLHHRNKSAEGTARTKSTGSGAWRQVCRHVVTLAMAKGQRALAVDKTNIAREDKEPIIFDLETVVLGVDEDGDEVTEAIFAPGGRAGYQDIDAWERAMAKDAEIDLTEPTEVAIRDKFQPGEIITKADMREVLPLNDEQLTKQAKALTKLGVLTFVKGRGYMLNPDHSS